jgi:alpha-L-fucosidase 2
MKTFQSMLLQVDPYSDKIYLLSAWPKEWDCEFKLHAPNNTDLQGMVINGHVSDLVVTPESRRKDIVFWNNHDTK